MATVRKHPVSLPLTGCEDHIIISRIETSYFSLLISITSNTDITSDTDQNVMPLYVYLKAGVT